MYCSIVSVCDVLFTDVIRVNIYSYTCLSVSFMHQVKFVKNFLPHVFCIVHAPFTCN